MVKKKILIVEDEMIIASDIEMILEKNGYEVTRIEDNATDALYSIKKNTPNLILLDINLEGDTDGIVLAEDINKSYKIPFIYLTSNTDPLTINRVKRTNPVGFIVKPFSEKDITTNVEIALFNTKQKKLTDFFVREGSGLLKVKIDNLLFAKADDNYTLLVTKNSEHLVSSTLKKVSEKLEGDPFIRIHRSYVINSKYIDKIQDGYVFIGKHRISIGRSYHDDFFKKISKL